MKTKRGARMTKRNIKIVFCLFLIVLLSAIMVVDHASAKSKKKNSKYYSNLTDAQIKELFALEGNDILNPWEWLLDAKTFVIVEDTGVGLQYWWNTPNIQMSATNELYQIITTSGYGSKVGQTAKQRQHVVEIPDEANTAMQKYGFNIPNPTYMGEKPLITISILGVLLPDNPLNAVSRVFKFAVNSDHPVVEIPTRSDFNSLVYVAPHDYNNSAMTFKKWVDKYWYDAMKRIDDYQVLMSEADSKDGNDINGNCWIRATIINGEGSEGRWKNLSEPGLDSEYICSELQLRCGSYYADVCENIIVASGIDSTHSVERIMPYDLESMSADDKSLFNGLKDPRCEMQKNFLDTGLMNQFTSLFGSCVLFISSWLSELTIALNDVANFKFFDSMNLIEILWPDSLLQVTLIIALSGLVVYCTIQALNYAKGSINGLKFVRKSLSMVGICAILTIFVANPQGVYGTFRDISNDILNFSNIILENDPSIESLYGQGNSEEKSQCELWLPYFNLWTRYQTGHGILDKEQKIEDDGTPERDGLIIPKIGETEQNLWSTVLADACSDEKLYSGNVYRMVDHFMAPRLEKVNLKSDGKVELSVKENENYSGNIQSEIEGEILLFQLLILFCVIFKLILFIEVVFNIIMIVYNISLSILDMNKIKRLFIDLGASLINVFIINIIVSITVWTSLKVEGIPGFVIVIMYGFFIYQYVKSLVNGYGSFCPKFLRKIREGFNMIRG